MFRAQSRRLEPEQHKRQTELLASTPQLMPRLTVGTQVVRTLSSHWNWAWELPVHE